MNIYKTYKAMRAINLKFLSNVMYPYCNVSNKSAKQLLMFGTIDERNINKQT